MGWDLYFDDSCGRVLLAVKCGFLLVRGGYFSVVSAVLVGEAAEAGRSKKEAASNRRRFRSD